MCVLHSKQYAHSGCTYLEILNSMEWMRGGCPTFSKSPILYPLNQFLFIFSMLNRIHRHCQSICKDTGYPIFELHGHKLRKIPFDIVFNQIMQYIHKFVYIKSPTLSQTIKKRTSLSKIHIYFSYVFISKLKLYLYKYGNIFGAKKMKGVLSLDKMLILIRKERYWWKII